MNWLRLGVFLLLALGVSFAQQDSAQQPSQGQSSAQTDVGKPTDTDQPVFKGCLSGEKDNYTLTDESGKTYRLHSDKDINEHVGNMVEIRGTVKKEGMDSPQTSTTATAPQGLDVADIKTVSKGCSTSPETK